MPSSRGTAPRRIARRGPLSIRTARCRLAWPIAGVRAPKPAAPLLIEVPVRSGGESLGTVALDADRPRSGDDEPILHLAALAVLTAVTLAGGADEPSPRSRASLLRDLRLELRRRRSTS